MSSSGIGLSSSLEQPRSVPGYIAPLHPSQIFLLLPETPVMKLTPFVYMPDGQRVGKGPE